MGVVQAGGWGLAGGGISALIGLSGTIAAAGFRWPWQNRPSGVWTRATIGLIGLLTGAAVAAAAHSEIAGQWPALIMGASAPSVVRGILTRIEVRERSAPDGPG